MNKKRNYLIAIVIVIVGVACGIWLGLTRSGTFGKADNLPSDKNGVGIVPPVIQKPIGKLVHDQSAGKDFMSNQIIVEFNSDVSEEESLAIIASVGGVMEQRFTQAPLFLIDVEDKGDGSVAKATVLQLEKNVHVKSASLNYITTK